ncbi:uncharacterized protein MKK02DRAFT_39570 [Dioszegia hungarica]|uniref:Uncharacterized protein n=1 Tax=Dioszegia hungarica TaxID=4972 RepID=A0AA38HF52_9TREE|nr:uncharacterized protein MKK02DRAFT_39570 [Dioszegia hungarica]KAI9639275.1 hypothetical protein MKK02DRAFT_39570 [Dioszegia hungarica]
MYIHLTNSSALAAARLARTAAKEDFVQTPPGSPEFSKCKRKVTRAIKRVKRLESRQRHISALRDCVFGLQKALGLDRNKGRIEYMTTSNDALMAGLAAPVTGIMLTAGAAAIGTAYVAGALSKVNSGSN